MKLPKKFWLPLACFAALLLALTLRLPSLGSLPRGLNRDEAALAYNAYSLLKTGHDEHGVRLPITFHSFGDEKLGGYIYALIPFISIFGLTTVATKLPSFIAGLLIIFVTGAIADELTASFWDSKKRFFVRVIAMIAVAISPWGNHFSRVAYEAHLAMLCFLVGWYALVRALQKGHAQRWWLALSGFGLAYSLITYHSYQIIVPLFVVCTFLLLRKRLSSFDRVGMVLGIASGTIATLLLLSNNAIGSNLTKHAGITPYAKETLERQFALMRLALPTPTLANKFLSNKVTEGAFTFAKNVASVLSLDFLFISGTGQDVHNPGGMTNLHLLTLPFILVGLHFLFKQKTHPVTQLFASWLFITLIPSALTISPQHTIRASGLFPALEILAAIGFTAAYFGLKKNLRTILLIGVVLLASLSALRLRADYFVLAPWRDEAKSHEKYHLLAKMLASESKSADLVFTQQPSSSPYIWYLFEAQYDPEKLQKTVTYYPEDAEHFKHVAQIDNVIFRTVTWDELRMLAKDKKLSLVFRPEEVPSEMREGGEITHIETLHDHFGRSVYEVWHMGPSK